jgi:hypothetical protein
MRTFGIKIENQIYEVEKELSLVLFNRRGCIAVLRNSEDGDCILPSYPIDSSDLDSQVGKCQEQFIRDYKIKISDLEYIEKAVTFFNEPESLKLKSYFYMSEVSDEDIKESDLMWLSPSEAMIQLNYEAHIWSIRQAIEKSIDL